MGIKKSIRRLVIERLSDRITFNIDALDVDALDTAGEPHTDEAIRHTVDGLAYYYDPPVDPAFGQQAAAQLKALQFKSDNGRSADQFQLMDSPVKLDVPRYHSNPSAPKKIYLDFDGQMVTGSEWNNRVFNGAYNTGATINAPAFTLDDDLTTFNAEELTLIQDVWARISEDYAPYQVDVTTEEPPAAMFTAGNQAMRVVVSTNIDATNGQQWYGAAGGVAFLDSWTWTNGTPCWVFYNYMSGVPKYFADAASHEVGHTLNLSHDGRITPAEEYYNGHGTGETSWGPIMGPGYYSNVTQWSQGEYTSASNQEDDLAIMNTKLAYVADDHGNTAATATQLNIGTASTLATSGLIATRIDVDAIRFATQTGSITLNVDPFDYSTHKANLDAKITLLNSSGTVVAAVDNVNMLNSTLTVNVPKGFYTLLVDGSGRPAIPGDEGYSDYASVGKYSVSGTIVPNAAPTVVNDTASVVSSGSVLIDVLANDTDANNDTLNLSSIGSPAIGSAVIEAGKIRYTASSAPGQVTFAYTVVDVLGVAATGNVTVTTVVSLPQLVGVPIFGDGTAQRSMIQKTTVTIDRDVVIANNAFTLTKRGAGGGVVTTTATPTINSLGQTVVVLSFSGQFTRGTGLLSDGYYQLTIDGSKISRDGQLLDANRDGQGGDSYSIGTNQADNFFALYGDVDGDGLVGIAEFGQFRAAFGKSIGQAGYSALFDYEADGAVGISDFGQFRSRFGKSKMLF